MNTIIVDTDKINSTVSELTNFADELERYNNDISNSLDNLANAWFGDDSSDFIYAMRYHALFNSQKVKGKVVFYNQALTNIVNLYDDFDTTLASKSCSL